MKGIKLMLPVLLLLFLCLSQVSYADTNDSLKPANGEIKNSPLFVSTLQKALTSFQEQANSLEKTGPQVAPSLPARIGLTEPVNQPNPQVDTDTTDPSVPECHYYTTDVNIWPECSSYTIDASTYPECCTTSPTSEFCITVNAEYCLTVEPVYCTTLEPLDPACYTVDPSNPNCGTINPTCPTLDPEIPACCTTNPLSPACQTTNPFDPACTMAPACIPPPTTNPACAPPPPPQPPVGITVMPMDKTGLLLPWAVVIALLAIVAGGWLVVRRRT